MIKAEILGTSRSADGYQNILVWFAFSKDGKDLASPDGLSFKGRPAWKYVSRMENFLGMSREQKQKFLEINVKHQIGNIIREVIAKETLVQSVEADLADLVGVTFEADEVSYQADLNNDREIDATVTIKDDGTYRVS